MAIGKVSISYLIQYIQYEGYFKGQVEFSSNFLDDLVDDSTLHF